MDLGLRGGRIKGIQFPLQFSVGVAQLVQQGRRDGEQVTARQLDDLLDVAEAGPHHLGLVAVGLEVVEDLGHRDHARILGPGVAGPAAALFVPVQDAPHKRGDQGDPGLSTGHRLGEAEQQGQVAVDALPLKLGGGANPLPGGGHLDQHPVVADTRLVIETDELAGLGDRGLGIEAEPCIHLG